MTYDELRAKVALRMNVDPARKFEGDDDIDDVIRWFIAVKLAVTGGSVGSVQNREEVQSWIDGIEETNEYKSDAWAWLDEALDRYFGRKSER